MSRHFERQVGCGSYSSTLAEEDTDAVVLLRGCVMVGVCESWVGCSPMYLELLVLGQSVASI